LDSRPDRRDESHFPISTGVRLFPLAQAHAHSCVNANADADADIFSHANADAWLFSHALAHSWLFSHTVSHSCHDTFASFTKGQETGRD
jgi:hypothetical protein